MDNIISVDKLIKIYESSRVKALNNVSFSVEKGTITAIVGKSGSGKTTLLNMLGGLDVPTSGMVEVCGENIAYMAEKKLDVFRANNIGFVFQFFNLVQEFTGEENILFPLAVSGLSVDKSYFDKLINILGIEEIKNRLPAEMSGGQQQRVAIARALIKHPAVVLMDEPTGNLDEENSDIICNLLQELKSEFNQTFVLVTHDMSVADIAQNTITLKDGAIADRRTC